LINITFFIGFYPMSNSLQKQLRHRHISLEDALKILKDGGDLWCVDWVDADLCNQFFRKTKNTPNLPPVIPLILWQNCYYLGATSPLTPEQRRALSYCLGTDTKVFPISAESYRQWFRHYNSEHHRNSAETQRDPLTGEILPENIQETAQLHLSQVDDQIERIKTLILSALRNRASDIHLEPLVDGLRVRYRIDGMLRHVTTFSPEVGRRIVVALKVMSQMDIADSRRPQDGRIGEKYQLGQEDYGLDLRVNTLPCVSSLKGKASEKAVLRLLKQDSSCTPLPEIGFTPTTFPIYQSWLEQPQGMIILTGPTGSGKTSTLYASLKAIATESVNVVTVEDPVEYVLPGVTQTQVNEAAGMTFAAGLRSILRQDPDIIMIGEIRDCETAETAVRAALTGHLVFTTLHTNDAMGAIPRLKDIGPDPGLISDALLGVVAQRLVRRVCPHCAEPYTPSAQELAVLGLSPKEVDTQPFRKGRGCIQCFKTGYLGREALIELLNVDDRVRQIIYEGSLTQLNHYLNSVDYPCFRHAATAKVTEGLTTIEEIKRVLPSSALIQRSGKPHHRDEVGLRAIG
jgi:type II secretory ATPase GspE/PulE/Tfp pilus assembly ATPase PilB-like protein